MYDWTCCILDEDQYVLIKKGQRQSPIAYSYDFVLEFRASARPMQLLQYKLNAFLQI